MFPGPLCFSGGVCSLKKNLICVFQKYNADYDLSAKEGADSLAFISLMEEKLMPALVRDKETSDAKRKTENELFLCLMRILCFIDLRVLD